MTSPSLAARHAGQADTIAADESVEWRPIPGWEEFYEVSSDGQVRRLDGGHVSRWVTPGGYVQVGLRAHGRKPAKRSIHTLVLSAFVGPRPTPGHVTRHLDGDPSNNHLWNLAWGSQSQNMADAVRHGTHLNASKENCPQGHPYSAANTMRTKDGHRKCRTCEQGRSARYYAANRERVKARIRANYRATH